MFFRCFKGEEVGGGGRRRRAKTHKRVSWRILAFSLVFSCYLLFSSVFSCVISCVLSSACTRSGGADEQRQGSETGRGAGRHGEEARRGEAEGMAADDLTGAARAKGSAGAGGLGWFLRVY